MEGLTWDLKVLLQSRHMWIFPHFLSWSPYRLCLSPSPCYLRMTCGSRFSLAYIHLFTVVTLKRWSYIPASNSRSTGLHSAFPPLDEGFGLCLTPSSSSCRRVTHSHILLAPTLAAHPLSPSSVFIPAKMRRGKENNIQ